ncbi:hypothetical protein [Pedobacter gandavensis]|uniref:pectate lyase family protein n=1 Tax=Pedobacter gandavensis TaxID=2679963 RepID=UPI0029313CF8|nr:hypothetical protein [Pedobacter gandavensis]
MYTLLISLLILAYTANYGGPVPKRSVLTGLLNTEIIGFAAMAGGTTGGSGGWEVEVHDLAGFKAAAAADQPMVIKFSGQIKGSGFIRIKSNKTIIGSSGSLMEGIGLLVYGHHNVIIRNMTIRNVVQYSNIVIKEAAHHVWVDHCSLSSDRKHGWSHYDGLLDVGNRSDYITLSWNKLHDNHKAMLIGFGDENTDDFGHLKVTVYKNYFYNISERQPGVRFGQVHVFNNYLKNSNSYGIGSTMDATVRTDHNYFENVAHPIRTNFNSKPGFVVGATNNLYQGCGKNIIITGLCIWRPPYDYQKELLPTAQVPLAIFHGAGAK